MSYEDLRYAVDGGVATITINRPQVMNAYRDQTIDDLVAAFDRAVKDRSVGVIVLTGAGDRAFCSGGDVKWERERGQGFAERGTQGLRETRSHLMYAAIRAAAKPVIARVNGYAVGGGNHLAYVADFAIAAEHAVFAHNGPRVGAPTQGWMITDLARVIGVRRAKEMWMRCRRYTAAEMFDWGLVNAVVPQADLDAEVRRWADDLQQASPTTLRLIKRSFEDELEPLREAQGRRDYLAEINPGFWQSGEQREGAAAFLEKRRPDWTPFR